MTKLLDPRGISATPLAFTRESLSVGRLSPWLILELSDDEVVSMAIECDGTREADADITAGRVETFDSMDALILNLDNHRDHA